MTQQSVPTKPTPTDPTPSLFALIAITAVVTAAPALILSAILARLILHKRGVQFMVLLLAIAGAGLLYLWHRQIVVSLIALRDVATSLLFLDPSYRVADLWPIVRGLWSYTWPITPTLALLFVMLRKPTEAEQEAEQQAQERNKIQLATKQGQQKAAKAPDAIQIRRDGVIEDAMVIGAAGDGSAMQEKGWVIYPRGALNRHGVVLGETGKGKSEFLLRLAYGARSVYGWKVFFVDAKGSPAFADQFRATMIAAGVTNYEMFPHIAFDGWRGDRELIYNKLIATLDYTEPFYKNVTETVTRLAVFADQAPPRSAGDFLRRFDVDYLVQQYANDPQSMRRLKSVKKEHFESAYMRYDAFLSAIGPAFDGKWSFEDVDAGYFLLDMVAKREQGRAMGRYIIEDFAQAVCYRMQPGEHALFIVDEYPALAGAGEAAKLFEQVRSPRGNGGAGVFITSQSYAGLGEDADRMIQAANATIAFQQSDTKRIAERAGERNIKRRSYSTNQVAPRTGFPMQSQPAHKTETFSQRDDRDFLLSPDAVRRLNIGECYIIPSGGYQKVSVNRVPLSASVLQLANNFNTSEPMPLMLDSYTEAPSTRTPAAPSAPLAPATPTGSRPEPASTIYDVNF